MCLSLSSSVPCVVLAVTLTVIVIVCESLCQSVYASVIPWHKMWGGALGSALAWGTNRKPGAKIVLSRLRHGSILPGGDNEAELECPVTSRARAQSRKKCY